MVINTVDNWPRLCRVYLYEISIWLLRFEIHRYNLDDPTGVLMKFEYESRSNILIARSTMTRIFSPPYSKVF